EARASSNCVVPDQRARGYPVSVSVAKEDCSAGTVPDGKHESTSARSKTLWLTRRTHPILDCFGPAVRHLPVLRPRGEGERLVLRLQVRHGKSVGGGKLNLDLFLAQGREPWRTRIACRDLNLLAEESAEDPDGPGVVRGNARDTR